MPVWIYIQFIMLLGWLVAAFLFYWNKAWKIGTTFNLLDGLFISFRFATLGWLTSSILLGIIYVLYSMQSGKLFPVISLLVIPIAAISVYSLRNYLVKAESDRRDYVIKTKVEECKEWAQKFTFLKNEMIEIKIYLSNGRATGRLIIHDVNQKQAEEMNGFINDLPDQIHLVVFPKSNDDTNNDEPIIIH